MLLLQCVTPRARHVRTSPSPRIPASWHFSHVCHPLHVTPASQHSPPASTHSQHATSTHHGARCSHAGAQHFHICHSLLWSCYDSCHAFMWPNMCHTLRHMLCLSVCTCVHTNWVLPAICPILQVEIHCAVMSHPASYRCLPRSNCNFYFNSMHPDTLAYLPSPISQYYYSTSAHVFVV